MYVRMYVCMYVCVYVCMYMYVSIYICVCVCVCMYIYNIKKLSPPTFSGDSGGTRASGAAIARGGRWGRSKALAQSSSSPISPVQLQETMEQSGNNGSGNTPKQTEALISEVVRPTYASLLDADEGTLLSYKPAIIFNGKKCAQI